MCQRQKLDINLKKSRKARNTEIHFSVWKKSPENCRSIIIHKIIIVASFVFNIQRLKLQILTGFLYFRKTFESKEKHPLFSVMSKLNSTERYSYAAIQWLWCSLSYKSYSSWQLDQICIQLKLKYYVLCVELQRSL